MQGSTTVKGVVDSINRAVGQEGRRRQERPCQQSRTDTKPRDKAGTTKMGKLLARWWLLTHRNLATTEAICRLVAPYSAAKTLSKPLSAGASGLDGWRRPRTPTNGNAGKSKKSKKSEINTTKKSDMQSKGRSFRRKRTQTPIDQSCLPCFPHTHSLQLAGVPCIPLLLPSPRLEIRHSPMPKESGRWAEGTLQKSTRNGLVTRLVAGISRLRSANTGVHAI